MKELIIKYWLQWVFGLIVAGMGAGYKVLAKRIQKQMQNQKALHDGTQALLRNEIIKEYDKYMDRGYIPIYAMENVSAMYDAYHALGGNGTITKLVEELKEIPSKTKR
jgi:hypothetical protein